jgi:transposase
MARVPSPAGSPASPRQRARFARRACSPTCRNEGLPGAAERVPGYGIAEQLLIVATVTQQSPQVDAQWTHRGIVEHLHAQMGVSASQIGRILASLDVKPHRVRGWLNRAADPAFHTKAQAVCALYLDPPADTVLFSVDEKTCMQARSRKRATRPVRPGQIERREFEYRRHGTVSLMAAMNVTTGTVHPKIIKKNDSDTFIAFLTELAETVDPALKIHLILDNGSSHTSKQTRKWLAEQPRFAVTYTPCHASWLNMIEIFFSILTPVGCFAAATSPPATISSRRSPRSSRSTTAPRSPSAGPTTPSSSEPHEPPKDLRGAALGARPLLASKPAAAGGGGAGCSHLRKYSVRVHVPWRWLSSRHPQPRRSRSAASRPRSSPRRPR